MKRFLAASVLAVALVLSAGVDRLHAECYMVCEMWITPGGTSMTCGEVWCTDG